jgi:hypothetical protein
MDIKKLKKLISSLEEESYNNYVGTERNANHLLEMGKCNAYGNVLELIKELENKKEINENNALSQTSVISRFVFVKLKRETVEGMISTYEFLVWSNVGDEKKDCKKILKALQKAIE